jgi:hypothetical protein
MVKVVFYGGLSALIAAAIYVWIVRRYEVVWDSEPVVSGVLLTVSTHGPNPGCSAGTRIDCISPRRPGGKLIPDTAQVIDRFSSDPSKYSETFVEKSSERICVAITQSTGACEWNQTARGRLSAIEAFPRSGDRETLESYSPPTVDEELAALVQGNTAFNAPDRATVGKSDVIEARLSVTKTARELTAEITESGRKESDPLKVGDKMAATLIGGGAFDVAPSGPQDQLISHRDTTVWTWTVTPKQQGTQFLVLTFDVILSNPEGTRRISSFVRKIDVNVAWPETFGEWLEYGKKLFEGLNWVWATLLVPLAGFVYSYWRRTGGGRVVTRQARVKHRDHG